MIRNVLNCLELDWSSAYIYIYILNLWYLTNLIYIYISISHILFSTLCPCSSSGYCNCCSLATVFDLIDLSQFCRNNNYTVVFLLLGDFRASEFYTHIIFLLFYMHIKFRIQHSEHGESLKPRLFVLCKLKKQKNIRQINRQSQPYLDRPKHVDTADCLLASSQQYLFDKCLLQYVQSWTPDDGRKDRPKHVECHSKIK